MFMVFIRSISGLPSHRVWGLGFLSLSFLLLLYIHIWAGVPGLLCVPCTKNALKFKFHLTYWSAPAWGWPSAEVEQLPLPAQGAHKGGSGVPVLQNQCLVTSPVLLHTQGQQKPLGWGSLRPPSGLGQTLDVLSIRSTHPEGLIQLHVVRPVWNALGYLSYRIWDMRCVKVMFFPQSQVLKRISMN